MAEKVGISAGALEATHRGDTMTADDRIESPASSHSGTEASGASSALRSVVLNICALHGARRILWIGPGSEPLAVSLQQAGYTVWGMDPGCHCATRLAQGAPASPADATGMAPDPPRGEPGRFDIALSTESPEPSSELGEWVQLAAHALQPGGLFLLPTPYRDSLKTRFIDWYNRWRSRPPSWAKRRVKRLLESHGFVLAELIGVREASWQFKTVIWVARQGGCPPSTPSAAGSGLD